MKLKIFVLLENIRSYGKKESLNVAVAAGIAIYDFKRKNPEPLNHQM